MTKDEVLAILLESDGFVSGERMREKLGVSRMSVSNAVKALRAEGCVIESVTNRGYRLLSAPDLLTRGGLRRHLGDRADRVECFAEIDSTNTYLKNAAMAGAADGTVAVAEAQTGGRGRLGRSFSSPAGVGIYLSLLLRPAVSGAGAMTFTPHVAVAVCRAIDAVCGVRAGIKWTNDIVLGSKKVCGILTELSLEAETGAVQYLVTGMGVNVNNEAFPPELRDIATSLLLETGRRTDRTALTAALIRELDAVTAAWEKDPRACLEEYRARCVNVGREAVLLRPGGDCAVTVTGIDEDFALLVRHRDGAEERITSGEVSVRGLYGYV